MDRCEAHELAALARAGDLEAIDRLTRCYGDKLAAIGRRVCRTEADAEDAVQTALLNASIKLTDWRGEGRLEAWLLRMVVNACHQMRRGRKNDPGLHETELDVLDETADPEVQAGRLELADALVSALNELSPRDRTLILLSEVEGWTGPELAARLDMTPSAVRTRLTRARKTLRVALS
jgi:RNA polymerase sigma-70 factor (ECF subfamily)